MAKKEKGPRKNDRRKRLLFRVVGSVILVLALLFALFLLTSSVEMVLAAEDVDASLIKDFNNPDLTVEYMYGISLLLLGLFELMRFAGLRSSERKSKKDFFRLGYAISYLVASVFAMAAVALVQLTIAASLLYLMPFFVRRVLHLIGNRKKVRALFYDTTVLVLLGILSLIIMISGDFVVWQYLLLGVIIFLSCLFGICNMALSNFNNAILKKVIRKTYVGEILFGLLLLIVAFSIVLMRLEESIHTFGDGLWYCFMVVTTIGFGDLTAVSIIGRILSVILGLYGIVVVSIFTSIIVNFYNEVKDAPNEEGAFLPNEDDLLDQSEPEGTPPSDEEPPTIAEKPQEDEPNAEKPQEEPPTDDEGR